MANLTNINNKFLVTTGGNVGINTTSPDSKLDVTGGDITVNTTGTGFMNFKYSNSQKGTIGTDGIDLKITANADLQLLPQGNVGIGTASPAVKLHVENGDLRVRDSGNVAIQIVSSSSGQSAIQFGDDGDTNDGRIVYMNDTDLMRFFTNDSEKMVINSVGNVGIGTNAPSDKLHVNSGTANSVALFESTDTAAVIKIKDSTGECRIETRNDFRFSNNAGANERMRIDSNGNVGIGTTSPKTNLEVIGGLNVSTNTVSATTTTMRIGSYGTSSQTYYGAKIVAHTNFTQTANTDLSFDLGSLGEVMRLHSSGSEKRVGIGTTSPGRKLTVTGDVSGDANNLLLSNENDTNGDSASIGFSMLSNNTYVKSGIFFERTTTQGRGSLHLAVNNEINGNNVSKSDAKISINNSGNVGIGTTVPSYKLEVNGGTALVGGGFYVSNDQTVLTSSTYTFRDAVYINNPNSTSAAVSASSVMSIGASSGNSVNTSLITTGAIGIGTTSPRAKLEVNGELIAKDIKHSNFAVGSLNTTGYTIATVTGGGNGSSAQIEFIGMGGTSGIVDVVYSCTNQSGNWYAYKKARQTPTLVDVDVTGHGTTTLSFVFKSLSSGGAAYTPRLMMKGSPSALVTF